jgi:excinuclease ABC subunit C
MVVFQDALPRKADYRKFKVRGVSGAPDDFASMREVVGRRYRRLLEEGKELPELVLIDGGKGQLGAAVEALEELGLGEQAVASLAKREELIFVRGRDAPLVLPRRSPVLQLVQRVRDEAHRFAVGFHRQTRSRRTLRSELDDIAGIGPAKRRALLSRFGSVRGVRGASEAELATAVGRRVAARIRGHFDR